MLAVEASRYAVISHGRLCVSPKSRPIVGRQHYAENDQHRLSMREGLARTVLGVGIHKEACSGPEIGARSGVRAATLSACCKARPLVGPAAAADRADVALACGTRHGAPPRLLQCAKIRPSQAERHFLAGAAAGTKLPVGSASWHCCSGAMAYISWRKVPGAR